MAETKILPNLLQLPRRINPTRIQAPLAPKGSPQPKLIESADKPSEGVLHPATNAEVLLETPSLLDIKQKMQESSWRAKHVDTESALGASAQTPKER